MDLAVFHLEPVSGGVFQMVLGLGRRTKRVTGIEKLVQVVVKLLLTTPGTDAANPAVGGGLQRLFLEPLSPSRVPSVQEDIALSVAMIEDEILRTQESAALPSDERLRSLGVEEVSFDSSKLKWTVAVRLVSEAGADFVLDLSDLLQRNV